MSDVAVRELLVQGRVPAAVADALATAGLNLELFGTIAVSVDGLETELASWVDTDLLQSETVVMPALRLLFLKHAHPGLLPDYSALLCRQVVLFPPLLLRRGQRLSPSNWTQLRSHL